MDRRRAARDEGRVRLDYTGCLQSTAGRAGLTPAQVRRAVLTTRSGAPPRRSSH